MLKVLDKWLLGDCFRPEADRLEVWNPAHVEREDLARSFSENAKEINRLLDMAQAAAERHRRAARSGGESGSASAEREAMNIARSMLPSLDALDRITEFGQQSDREEDEEFQNWLKCVDGLRTRLLRTLENFGVTPVSSVGREVDLNVHDVVSVVPATAEFPSNTVVEEQQRGYYFRGKLLRDARVVVAQ